MAILSLLHDVHIYSPLDYIYAVDMATPPEMRRYVESKFYSILGVYCEDEVYALSGYYPSTLMKFIEIDVRLKKLIEFVSTITGYDPGDRVEIMRHSLRRIVLSTVTYLYDYINHRRVVEPPYYRWLRGDVKVAMIERKYR